MSGMWSGMASGAGSGAMAGSSFGPWGAVIGGVVGAAAGAYSGSQADKAAQAQEDALNAQKDLTNSEIERRRQNIIKIRGAYGEVDSRGTPAQQDIARRMGSKLTHNVNQQAQNVSNVATQQNLASTSSGLTGVNANAAITGNKGSATRRGAGAVMGRYLNNKASIAGTADANRAGAYAGMEAEKAKLENSVLTGSMPITQSLQSMQQAGSMQAAKQMVYPGMMGSMLQQLTNQGQQSSAMNIKGYDTPNFFGGSLQSGGSVPGQRVQTK